MEIKELYATVRDSAFDMRRAMSITNNHMPHIERMKNILFNSLDDIESALKFASEAEEKIKVLELELDDAEKELDEAIAAKSAKPEKTTKKKAAGAANG